MRAALATAINAAWHDHARHAARLARGPGSVFTPREVAVRLAGLVLGPLDAPPRLLDPACGAGALLLGALEWTAAERPDWTPKLLESITGWDADPACAEACNAVLRHVAKAAGASVREYALARDGLAGDAEPAFQAVIANPPWVSYSGRHAVKLAPARRAELAGRFAAFRGWPSLHAAFAQRCAELVADTGRVGLLLPLQVAEQNGYAAARDAMTARHRLETLADLGESVFPGVTEPTGMFVLAPQQGRDAGWNATAPVPHTHHKPLPPECFGDIGVHTGNAAALLLAKTPEPGAMPVRVGRDIAPYALAAPSLWVLDIALPEGQYARVPPPARFQDVQIVLRQTADRPIAARHEPVHGFRNSVLACFGAPGHDPDFLLAVFNSDAAAALHRAAYRDARQRTFPQLKLAHLRALPVPAREDAGPLYERIANAARAAGTDADAAELANRLVAELYEYR